MNHPKAVQFQRSAGFVLAAGLIALLMSAGVQAQSWSEQGDAPELMPGQQTIGSGELHIIEGVLQGQDDVDLFCIQIIDPVQFRASTVGAVSPDFNTQLFLFDDGGRGVSHSDDAEGTPQSTLTELFVQPLGPGIYALAIGSHDRDAASVAGQPIWQNAPPFVERPADGPGASQPLGQWIGSGLQAQSYCVLLQGAAFWSADCTPPQISQCPVSQAVEEGGTATLSVMATGTPPLSYQWMNFGGPISGATGPTLVIPNAGEADHGPYWVIVTNLCGSLECPSVDVMVHECCNPPPQYFGSCHVPDPWWFDPVSWARDLDRDGLDDLFNSSGPSVRHNILVDFRACITDSHVAFLENVGPDSQVQRVFTAITTVAMSNVSRAEMLTIIGHVDVAMIEKQLEYVPLLDVSVPTIRVTGPAPSVESELGLTGAGINIAIMDTGVDDGLHEDLPIAIAGFNAVTNVLENPEDNALDIDLGGFGGHGTHVASIALGGGGGGVSRGVAPDAGLVDVKVIGTPPAVPPADPALSGLQWIIDNHLINQDDPTRGISIHVINMSFGTRDPSTGERVPSDGNDALCQMVDVAVELGMFVAAAAGNDGHTFPPPGPISAPAAAALAMAVGASDDRGTIARSDDEIWEDSSDGPRMEEWPPDSDLFDELKPEVAAPGTAIRGARSRMSTGGRTLSGTSMATPHVAGLAALAKQAKPGLSPGIIKQALIDTAERRGEASWFERSPDWNNVWGWGLVDGLAFLERSTAAITDVDFNRLGSPRHWAQRSIFPESEPRFGVPNRLTARLRNNGSGGTARNVKVEFFVQTLTAAVPAFTYLASATVPTILEGPDNWVDATIDWTPSRGGGWSRSGAHWWECIRARIVYPGDSNLRNNEIIRNIAVAASPVYFEARNFVSDTPMTITFVPEFAHPERGWGVQITPPSVRIGPGDSPPTIEALPLPPPGAPDGEQEWIDIEARSEEGKCLGGVQIVGTKNDCNGNDEDDWLDIQNGTSADCNENGKPDECDLLALIGNGHTGDGRLELRPDPFGAFQTIGGSGNGDGYDPVGGLAGAPTYSSAFFLFSGTGYRELLAEDCAWQDTDFGGSPLGNFSADESLTAVVRECCTVRDTNGDGVDDTMESVFDVHGVRFHLSFELTQSVSEPDAYGVAQLRQIYTITNIGTADNTFKLVRAYDGNLPWTGAPVHSDDWVGAGRAGLDWHVFQREPLRRRLSVTLSSPDGPDAYYAGKSGIDPDGPGGDPPFGLGTSKELWDAYGIPAGWRDFAAGVGRRTAGVSGSQPPGSIDPYDAFLGLEFVRTLAPRQTTTLTLIHSYGSPSPRIRCVKSPPEVLPHR